MRNAFADEITELAAHDDRVVLLSGDIGNRLFDRLKAGNAQRFLNCGVAEANMMGMAAGMAMSGLKPVVYTITPFTTTRCFEQIRVDVCYHEAPVTIVGTGAGLSYAQLGPTHHSLEDIGILRTLPGMTVLCPCDRFELRAALRAAIAHDGPVYLRIGKKNEPVIHEEIPELEIGRAIRIRDGDDVCLLSTGNIMPIVLKAADALEAQGISAAVESVHTVKPLDEALLTGVFEQFRVVATVEEHGLIGGLGSAVAEWAVDTRADASRLLRFGTTDEFMHEVGSQTYARMRFGLTTEAIAGAVTQRLHGGIRRTA